MKDSFILYVEQKEIIEKLSDEDAGKLIKAIYQYASTNEMPKLNNILELVFIPFKQQLDRCYLKWEDIRQKRSEAGKKGMEERWKNITNDNKQYQSITNITNVTDVINDDEIEQMSDKEFIEYLKNSKN